MNPNVTASNLPGAGQVDGYGIRHQSTKQLLQMRINPFFPVFAVLVGVVVYAYYAPEDRPEKGLTTTPKEYMELVQKNRAERVKKERQKEQAEAPR
ncbi:MAG TPA: hypothetical protein PLZ16_01240 [Gammaproteobacteria bacterium]|nr:hypothetical protein [Gammaproteobacteria bacterium]